MDYSWIAYVALAMVVFAWLSWNRYLYHKEVMRTLESGGDPSQVLGLATSARLAARERSRLRSGMLAGALLIAAGLATASGLLVAQPPERPVLGGVVGFTVFLFVFGAAILFSHLLWSREQRRRQADRQAAGEADSRGSGDTGSQDTR